MSALAIALAGCGGAGGPEAARDVSTDAGSGGSVVPIDVARRTLRLTSLQAGSDATNLYYTLSYTGTPSRGQLFLDTDRNAGTGYPINGIGASHLVEIGSGYGNLYSYSGSGGAWGWTLVKAITYTSAGGTANITVARADVGSPAGIDLIAAIADSAATVYSATVSQALSGPSPDSTAPSVPTGLTGAAVSGSQINLAWSASTDNVGVTGYVVYLNDVQLATTTGTSFSHTGLISGTTYNYRVSAFDAVPNHSAWTTPVAVTTPAVPALAVTSLQAGSDATNLFYTLSYTGAPTRIQFLLDTDRNAGTGYPTNGIGASHLVEIGSGYGNLYSYSGSGGAWGWTFVKSLTNTNAGGTASITIARTDVGSPAGIDLIAAIADSATTAYSAKVSQVLGGSGLDTTAPSVPTGLTGTAVSGSQINLAWSASTDNVGATGYVVYLNDVQLATTTGTSFSHTGLISGTTYNYRVSAFDAVPNHSAWTATPVAVTTPGSGPSTVTFSCSFPTAPNNCGFQVQEKVPGRASVVGFGRDGGTAVRLHTEPGDNNVAGSGDMQRTDLYLAQAGGAPIVFNQGEEHWWSISILFPDDFVFPTWQRYALAGFHHTGPTGQGNFTLGFERGLLDTDLGILGFQGYGGTQDSGRFGAPVGLVLKNVWYDFVYHVKWSSGNDGFFRAWVNGVKKLDHSGPTLYAGQGVYLKLANYHTPICDPYPACIGNDPPTSVIYDRVVRGTTPQAVSLGPLEGVLTLVNGVLTPLQ